MLLRARIQPGAEGRFAPWFRDVHLRDVARIPGVVEVQSGRTVSGTRLGLYTFESSHAVQAALASPEAAYARGTWEQWAGELDELSIELWGALFPLPLYRGAS
jgi:hypothetical protein